MYTAPMTLCPICQRPTPVADLVRNPYVYGRTLALTLKINPDWKREDGMCRDCVESIINTVAEIEDAKTQQRPSATPFSEYYRYTLTKREHGQWHQRKPGRGNSSRRDELGWRGWVRGGHPVDRGF